MAALVIELYGENSERLGMLAKRIKQVLVQTKDLVDVDIMSDEVYEKYSLVVDKEKVNRSHMSIEKINESILPRIYGHARRA